MLAAVLGHRPKRRLGVALLRSERASRVEAIPTSGSRAGMSCFPVAERLVARYARAASALARSPVVVRGAARDFWFGTGRAVSGVRSGWMSGRGSTSIHGGALAWRCRSDRSSASSAERPAVVLGHRPRRAQSCGGWVREPGPSTVRSAPTPPRARGSAPLRPPSGRPPLRAHRVAGRANSCSKWSHGILGNTAISPAYPTRAPRRYQRLPARHRHHRDHQYRPRALAADDSGQRRDCGSER